MTKKILMHVSGYMLLKDIGKKIGSKSKIAYVTIVPQQDVNIMKNVNSFIQKPFNNEDFIDR